ncbi:hypothetical protein [Bacillus suaedaesalsae]|uniref:Uncharacterized protein n=1 Tax=Bacillus suaedaesalsae TaxID=2810349 RepID=A0ABS2DF88_9BACI|nr:hypothetical protein [Bacillus suaedaesalsae]MBM6617125.1 hypothetical protein [Bacillus suaedaesalsae]
MALDESEESDEIVIINEIKVAIDPMIKENVEGLTLDISGDGQGLSLLGDTGNCC